jgi:hypothetical protein
MKGSRVVAGARNVSDLSIRSNQRCFISASNAHSRASHHHVPTSTSLSRPTAASDSQARRRLFEPYIQRQGRSFSIQIPTPGVLGERSSSTRTTKSSEPTIHSIYEPVTGTWQYIVADPSSLQAVIIDSVLDYDPSCQTISTQTADSLLSLISQHGYQITRILETHAHADHLTAAAYLQHQLGKKQGLRPPICIGKRITQVQEVFGKRYGAPKEQYEGSFDELLDDDQCFRIGDLVAKVVHLPGHTPDHIGYIVGGT